MKLHLNRRLCMALFLIVLSRIAHAAIITVTTTNNVSPLPGEVSLKQAIAGLHDGDTIRFNISGVGPYYIQTPTDGYALITNNNVTIDGYSQTNSMPHTTPILARNN